MATINSKSIIRQVLAIVIGSAIFVALTKVQIPVGFVSNTALQVRAAVLAFFSAVFGPVAGFAIGLVGHTLGDAFFYGQIWWSWVFPDALFGLLVGVCSNVYEIESGSFGIKQCILFNVVQILANALSWVVLAPILDIIIFNEPVNKVFLQGLTSAVSNTVIVAILGSLLAFACSKIKTRSISPKEKN